MRSFGLQLRRSREFLGLSQEEIARQAGVSQGAVSRLETAHGLATPMIVVLRIQDAVVHHLRKLDPALLSPELRQTVELQGLFTAPLNRELAVTEDTALEQLVRMYRETPERYRQSVIAIVKAVVEGLKASGS
jgi:transcriptional regulator with XRE-family HTH domain